MKWIDLAQDMWRIAWLAEELLAFQEKLLHAVQIN